jgi:hypothetical protein
MISKVVIGYLNLIPSGAVTANGADASFPAINVQEDDPALAWHSSGTTAYLDVDYGSVPEASIELVAAIGTNGSDTMTRRVRFDDDAAFGSPSHDSDDVDDGDAFDVSRSNPLSFTGPFGRDVVYLSEQDVGDVYGRMDLVDAANPDGFIRVGIWWMGPTWSPASAVGFTWRDETQYTDEGRVVRRFALIWRYLTRADAAAAKAIMHKLAGVGRVYLVLQNQALEQWHLEAMLCTIEFQGETPVDDYVQVTYMATEADW